MITVQISSLLLQRTERVSLWTEEITVKRAARSCQAIEKKKTQHISQDEGDDVLQWCLERLWNDGGLLEKSALYYPILVLEQGNRVDICDFYLILLPSSLKVETSRALNALPLQWNAGSCVGLVYL